MVPGCQGLGGDEGGQPSNSPDLIDQKSDSECVRESARSRPHITTAVSADLLSPASQVNDYEGGSRSSSRAPSAVTVEDPYGKRKDIYPKPEGDTASVEASREDCYSQNSASENSFASIKVVNDLGFKRQAESSNTNNQRSNSLHPREALQDPNKSNASLPYSPGDKTREISAQKWLAKRLGESLCKSKSSDKDFIPICEIERILSLEAVREVLKEEVRGLSGAESDAELEKLTQDICGVPSRRRLFAHLLRGEKADYIRCFIECGVDDTDLPFIQSPSNSELAGIHPRSDTTFQKRLKCFEKWNARDVEWFLDRQHVVASPFFDLAPGKLLLYSLPKDTILPFTEAKVAGEGGYANVWKILIHPAHHNFPCPAGTEKQYFAVKTLHTHRHAEYEREVEVLQRFSGGNEGHPHLIRLLLAYQHEEKHHMIFPWANGNLRDFWESIKLPNRTKELACWMLSQFHGISEGLREIHGNGNELNPNDRSTGRHGDIKAENILWIENHNDSKNHLLICDFGLSRFHSVKSQSEDRAPGCSPSYRPPECDLYHLRISVKYDIWTLGCLLLEFLTWYLLGWDAVEGTFSDARMRDEGWTRGVPLTRPDKDDSKWLYEDKFFRQQQDGNLVSAQLKPSVIAWMEKLHRLDHCPEFAHDILDIIHGGLLHPDKRKRWDCFKIVTELEAIHKKCINSVEYCLTPHRWEGRPLEVFNVSYRILEQLEIGSLTGMVGSSSQQQHQPQSGNPSPRSLSPVSRNPSRAATPTAEHESGPLSAESLGRNSTAPNPESAVGVSLQLPSGSTAQDLPSRPQRSTRTPDGPGANISARGTGSTSKTTTPLLPLPHEQTEETGRAKTVWRSCKDCARAFCGCFRGA